MSNKELQELLKQFPDDLQIKFLANSNVPVRDYKTEAIREFTDENILHTSEGAWVDDEAPEDEWDCEDGKIRHKGAWYLLINPIIT